MTPFDQAFKILIGEEGGLSTNPADPGNWTGGACHKGVCRGTKFGIAASAHPELDIAALTLAEAQEIYRTSYWTPVRADELPPALALLVFDATVNCGASRAVRWLQTAAGIGADGEIGAVTLAAVRNAPGGGTALCAEFQAQRLAWMTSLPTWRSFGLGWSRRLCLLPYQSLDMGASSTAPQGDAAI
jgi:lysozyme family protein